MAQTTMYTIEPGEWTAVAKNPDSVIVKANTGNWKSWRVYFSEDDSTPPDLTGADDDPGELYNGNLMVDRGSFSGTLFVITVDEPIVFSVTVEGGDSV